MSFKATDPTIWDGRPSEDLAYYYQLIKSININELDDEHAGCGNNIPLGQPFEPGKLQHAAPQPMKFEV